MTSMLQGLNFDLPKPTKQPGKDSPFVSRQAFEAWFRRFQVSNPEQTAHALSATLAEMNATPLSVDDRLYALTRLYGYVTLTAELFSEHSYQNNEDLFEKLNKQQSVLDLFGQGCCLLVQELLGLDDGAARAANLARAIHLAINSYSQLMVEGYASHYVGANAAWKYVNKLYLLAERLGLSEQVAVNHSSIKHCYLRIAVLSLSNPYHLMQGEARLLYKKLDDWVKHADLINNKTASISGKPFVDLASDTAPVRLRNKTGWSQVRPAEGRLIDIDLLISGIDNLLHSMLISRQGMVPESSFNQRILRDFYMRLRDVWSARKERQSERQEQWKEIEVATGLSAVNYYMREKQGEELSEFSERAGETGDFLTDSHLTLVSYDGHKATSRPGVWSRIDVNEDRITQAPQHVTVQDKYPLNTWLQCDISEGGIAVCHARNQMRFSGCGEMTENGASFSLPSAVLANVRVGDLIAYRTKESEGERWEVGAIRWMRLDRRSGVKFGIMRITRDAEAAKVRAINGVGAGSAHGDALLVEDKTLQGGTIITPAAIYDIGTRLELSEARFGRKLIRLSRQVLSSAKFSLFEFQTV